jgi:hypothetical protein
MFTRLQRPRCRRSVTPASSASRSLIDAYRIRRRTAANQSVASVAGASNATLERQIEIDGETVRITDVARPRKRYRPR